MDMLSCFGVVVLNKQTWRLLCQLLGAGTGCSERVTRSDVGILFLLILKQPGDRAGSRHVAA